MSTDVSAVAAARDLAALFDPPRLLLPDRAYDQVLLRIWNGESSIAQF